MKWTRVRLQSPYGQLRRGATPTNDTLLRVPNGAEGRFNGRWVEFDQLPGVRIDVPFHWLIYIEGEPQVGAPGVNTLDPDFTPHYYRNGQEPGFDDLPCLQCGLPAPAAVHIVATGPRPLGEKHPV